MSYAMTKWLSAGGTSSTRGARSSRTGGRVSPARLAGRGVRPLLGLPSRCVLDLPPCRGPHGGDLMSNDPKNVPNTHGSMNPNQPTFRMLQFLMHSCAARLGRRPLTVQEPQSWIIPTAKLRPRMMHPVPLSSHILALLRGAKGLESGDGSPPSAPSGPVNSE